MSRFQKTEFADGKKGLWHLQDVIGLLIGVEQGWITMGQPRIAKGLIRASQELVHAGHFDLAGEVAGEVISVSQMGIAATSQEIRRFRILIPRQTRREYISYSSEVASGATKPFVWSGASRMARWESTRRTRCIGLPA